MPRLVSDNSVLRRDEEYRDGDRCDCLDSDDSLPRQGIGPKDEAVNNCSQTNAGIFRCILMSGKKRHQQATILDGSGLQLGHPSSLSAT